MWKMAVDRKPLLQLRLRIKKKKYVQNHSFLTIPCHLRISDALISDKPPIKYRKTDRGIPKGIWTRPEGKGSEGILETMAPLRRLKTEFSCRKLIQAENEPMSATSRSCGITNYESKKKKEKKRWWLIRELWLKRRFNI